MGRKSANLNPSMTPERAHRLALENLDIAHREARRFAGSGKYPRWTRPEQGDLVQVAYIALYEAALRCTDLTFYRLLATRRARWAIWSEHAAIAYPVYIPVHMVRRTDIREIEIAKREVESGNAVGWLQARVEAESKEPEQLDRKTVFATVRRKLSTEVARFVLMILGINGRRHTISEAARKMGVGTRIARGYLRKALAKLEAASAELNPFTGPNAVVYARIAKALKASPSKSNRQLERETASDRRTISKVRHHLGLPECKGGTGHGPPRMWRK